MIRSKIGLLATGVSAFALVIAAPGVAGAETVEGEFRTGDQNFYTVGADETVVTGTETIVSNPGGFAAAFAAVTCATDAQCPNPGSIWMDASNPGGPAANSMIVDGSLTIRADARASGGAASANAIMHSGIWQGAHGADASNSLTNDGILSILVNAQAIGSTGFAAASAVITNAAIIQSATATNGVASNSFSNDGSLDISARAEASAASGGASAIAEVGQAIAQNALGTEQATSVLSNSGIIDVVADADAVNTNGNATAWAAVGIDDTGQPVAAIEQRASARDASLSFSNGGTINLTADANAIAAGTGATPGSAAAVAKIGFGIWQFVEGATNAAVTLDNGGAIDIGGHALASGSGGAEATVLIIAGISQYASVYTATADGLYIGSGSVDLVNSGSIDVAAEAVAHSSGGSANVHATISTGINQHLHTVSEATVSLANGGGETPGVIDITASAAASGVDARADAAISYGISQWAQATSGAAGSASISLENSGDINVGARANTSGAGESGLSSHVAVAQISAGIRQFGLATGVDAGSMDFAINNSGNISLSANASAAPDAAATAAAGAYIDTGIYQGGFGQDSVTASLTNSGTMEVSLGAHAAGSSANAVAEGIRAVYQQVVGFGENATASASIVNEGAATFAAEATASGVSYANAKGVLSSGFFQTASAIADAMASMSNIGDVSVTGDARAIANQGDAGSARATASGNAIGGVINVFAAIASSSTQVTGDGTTYFISGSPTGAASANFTNTGTFDVAGNAYAESDGFAIAFALGGGELQLASGTDARASIVNEGEFIVSGFGSAVAANTAIGQGIVNGVRQTAQAIAYTTIVMVGASGTSAIVRSAAVGTAAATLINSGHIEYTATAIASVDENADDPSTGSANAYAYDQAIRQDVNAATAMASVENAGDIDITNLAVAVGGGTATAFAIATGVAQRLFSISAEAQYTAGGGVFQNYYTVVGEVSASIVNSGSMDIQLNSAADAANALANAEAISFFQFGNGTKASLALVNSGGINVDVDAAASGDGSAVANAIVRGVEQRAIGTAEALVLIDNSGEIGFAARANAVAASSAQARAVLVGGAQQAVSTGVAAASVLNSGTFEVSAAAAASAGGSATADAGGGSKKAPPIALFQQALGATTATVLVENAGTMNIGLTADASAEGAALALAGFVQGKGSLEPAFVGIAQEAVVGSLGTASVSLANSGSMSLSVDAQAEAGMMAQAAAGMVDSIFQAAAAGSEAEAFFTNGGDLLASAFASAVATGGGSALASANADMGGLFQFAQIAQTSGPAPTTPKSDFATAASPNGAASATLQNSGSLALTADAKAVSNGIGAVAVAEGGAVTQVAIGTESGLANALIANSGTIGIALRADASASSAFALAAPGTAMAQMASGGLATVGFENSGTINIVAEAHAVGLVNATAFAGAAPGDTEFALPIGMVGVSQEASAGGAGSAAASLTNSGTLNILASGEAAAGGFAGAVVGIGNGIAQSAAGGGEASVSIDNSGDIVIAAEANVVAQNAAQLSAVASASVFAQGFFQSAAARTHQTLIKTTSAGGGLSVVSDTPTGPASASLVNSGSFEVLGSALVTADNQAGAWIEIDGGRQAAFGSDASASIVNGGILNVAGVASVLANTNAVADVHGSALIQQVEARGTFSSVAVAPDGAVTMVSGLAPVGPAVVSLSNTGTFDVEATADAVAAGSDVSDPSATSAGAGAAMIALQQFAYGSSASVTAENSGSVSLDVDAVAEAEGNAYAVVGALGIRQGAFTTGSTQSAVIAPDGSLVSFGSNLYVAGPASVSLENSGTIDITASGSAVSGGLVTANAAATGIVQGAMGTDIALNVTNDGDLNVGAAASASGSTGNAYVQGAAILQKFTFALEEVSADVSNSGSLTVDVTANAVQQGGATAVAIGIGASQSAIAGSAVALTFENGGEMSVAASANAEGGFFAGGTALVIGAQHLATGPNAQIAFANSGDLSVAAAVEVTADGEAGFAGGTAVAHGYYANASQMEVSVVNSGDLSVQAEAHAIADTGWAWATAEGIALEAIGGTTSAVTYGALEGSIINSGDIIVAASAAVEGPDELESTATAVGISMLSGTNNLTLTNSGLLQVTAVVDGGEASANGIVALRPEGAPPAPSDVSAAAASLLTITNDGGEIISAVSLDGGETYGHGMAIDVSLAPNATLINLLGDGSIYGDIDIAAGDEIVVADGETGLDGVINPEFVGLDTDDAAGPMFEGSLSIEGDGSLYLRNAAGSDMYDGPAQAYVESFDMAPGAMLAVELSGMGDGEETSYGQVFANTATIDGSLELRANFGEGLGLYDDLYLLDNVIEADALEGTFDSVALAAPSIFIDVEAVYDEDENVDVRIERTAFGELGGESANQAAVGGAIENVYGTDLDGGFGELVAELFTLDEGDYYDALDQLSGAQYAGYLHALRNASFSLNSLVSDQIDCAVSIRGVDQCRDPEGGVRVWAMGGYGQASLDSDSNAAGYDQESWSALAGADYTTGAFTIGGFAGYRSLDFTADGAFAGQASKIGSDGWQLGLYAGYDIGSFYARAIGSYVRLDGESERGIAIGSFGGQVTGEPDVSILSFYGEAGARFDLGGSWVTPFVAIDHAGLSLDGFTETGLEGANLQLGDQDEGQTSLLAGLKWAGNFGGIVPEVKVAYRYDLNDDPFGIDASFADAPSGSGFRVVAPEESRGSVVAGLSLAGAFSQALTGRIGYQGRFSGEVSEHAAYGSLTFRFGGAAPVPPPLPEAPPAPPPPPPPPPPPAPQAAVAQGPFIVFFDWDRSDLTGQAQAILDNAAAAYQATGQAQVMLAGHADRSGPDQYNVELSQRRADTVRSYLAGRGIPEAAIATQALGESQPLVQTADGVREPQNRRVQISYGPGAGY